MTAASQLMLRRMALRDSADRLVAWNLIATVPLGVIVMLPVWSMPTWSQLGLLAMQGALGALNMTLITRAFGMAAASVLAPLDFLRLPVVALMAFSFFLGSAGGTDLDRRGGDHRRGHYWNPRHDMATQAAG